MMWRTKVPIIKQWIAESFQLLDPLLKAQCLQKSISMCVLNADQGSCSLHLLRPLPGQVHFVRSSMHDTSLSVVLVCYIPHSL
jgi:hypothetical protein